MDFSYFDEEDLLRFYAFLEVARGKNYDIGQLNCELYEYLRFLYTKSEE